ncbi:hypothetical protein RFI_17344, partial [Reticulomyxa filosa]
MTFIILKKNKKNRPCNTQLCPESGSMINVGKYYIIKFSEPNWNETQAKWEFKFYFLGANKAAVYLDRKQAFYANSASEMQFAISITTGLLQSGWHIIEIYTFSSTDMCDEDISQVRWEFRRGKEELYQLLTIENLLLCTYTSSISLKKKKKNKQQKTRVYTHPFNFVYTSNCVYIAGLPCHMQRECLEEMCGVYLSNCTSDIECANALTEIWRTGIAYMNEYAYAQWRPVANCSATCCALEDAFVVVDQDSTNNGGHTFVSNLKADTLWFSVVSNNNSIGKAALQLYQSDNSASKNKTLAILTFTSSQI